MSLSITLDHLASLLTEGRLSVLRRAVTCALLFSALYYAALSVHWPLMLDSPVMHYVNFMMDHGLKPYQDITDNNMPGAYLAERWAMDLFGAGDFGWRLYEFFLLGVLTLAAIVIARPYDWLAGLYAGGMFLLLHGAEGPSYAVEREEVMTVLILVGYAFFFEAIRRQTPWLMLPFGFLVSLAGSIKPTVGPLVLLLLLIAVIVLRQHHLRSAPYLVWGLLGVAGAATLIVRFLHHFHAFGSFFFLLRTITPTYVGLWQPSVANLVRRSWPVSLLPLLPLGGLALFLNRRGWTWEKSAMACGFAFGGFSYLAQGKGFNHHRYTFLVFFLLLVAIEFTTALRRSGLPRLVGAVALAFTLAVIVPYDLAKIRILVPDSDLTLQLERDLNTLGGPPALDGKVQCFDLIFGCLNALYHDHVLQNSGFTGDLLLFPERDSPASQYYRAKFRDLARRNPAQVLVVTNEWFGRPTSFSRLDTWPEFVQYLNANYTQVLARSFPYEGVRTPVSPESPDFRAYRIYIRHQSPLLARVSALSHP